MVCPTHLQKMLLGFHVNAIDAYIAPYPLDVQLRLQEVRAVIAAEAPDAVETLSYGLATFDLCGKHLVHFGGFARHIGFYPTRKPIVVFADALAGYKTATGSIQFPLNQPTPLELIREMVRFRVAEVRAGVKKPKHPR